MSNIINLPVDIHTTMISSNVKQSRRKIQTQIGGIYVHPTTVISDFDLDEFINDFNVMIQKTINTPLRIHIEYDEYDNLLDIIVHTTKMIDWDYMTKIEKCANVLLKFCGKYKKPPRCLVIESYTPVA